jgi:hypothetical protein
MAGLDVKGDLHTYLRGARETLVWKLDGLGEYDLRRPLTPTGTNLVGHADIVRELIDGSAGLLEGHHNLRLGDRARWGDFRDRVEAAARLAGGN